MNRRWPIAGLMVLVYSAAASAATFEVVSGEGSMNRGLGFRPVTGSVAVQPGSTLHVPLGAQAYVVYDNGCRVRVTPGAFVRVQKNTPCDPKASDLPATGAVATQGQNPNCDPNSSVLGCADPITLGAVTLIGAGGLIWGITEANKSNKQQYFPQLSP